MLYWFGLSLLWVPLALRIWIFALMTGGTCSGGFRSSQPTSHTRLLRSAESHIPFQLAHLFLRVLVRRARRSRAECAGGL